MRDLLESIKAVVDQIYQAEPTVWSVSEMVLFPPAKPKDIEQFFNNPPMSGIPRSYGDFLLASDGLDESWGRMNFFGTGRSRWEKLLQRIAKISTTVQGNVRYQVGEPTPENIRAWELKRDSLHPSSHPVIGVGYSTAAVIYDTKTADKSGRMDLCDWHLADSVRGRYPDLRSYFEACLTEAQNYYKKEIASKGKRKKR
jgi:hypothetical protein